MLQTYVPVVLLDTGLSGTAGLRSIDLTTFAEHSVHAWSLESQVDHRPKEIFNQNLFSNILHVVRFQVLLATRMKIAQDTLNVVPEQKSADAIEGHTDKGKKCDRDGFLRCRGD